MALIGQLAANIAHELNSPLQGIVTFSHLMLEDQQCDNPSHAISLNKIVEQADRCRSIARGLLDFSRQGKPNKTPSDINTLLGNCISLVENQALFHNIQITKKLQENLPLATVDTSQIERVFINMIMNASEAMQGNGQLSLATHFNPTKEIIEIVFSDTGAGISEENLKKIFVPFFTTKDIGYGTGLGLAICYGIVQNHNGTISVHSEIGKGTTFVVSLPLRTSGVSEKNG